MKMIFIWIKFNKKKIKKEEKIKKTNKNINRTYELDHDMKYSNYVNSNIFGLNYNFTNNNKLKKAKDIFKFLLNKLKRSNGLYFSNKCKKDKGAKSIEYFMDRCL